jgi:hypothetical protein
MADPRKIPTDRVRKLAIEIFAAAAEEDADALVEACAEWLALKGHGDESPIEFKFSAENALLDTSVTVQAQLVVGDETYVAIHSSGYPPTYAEDEITGASISMLIGIDLAIEGVVRKIMRNITFPDRNPSDKLWIALQTLAAT